MDNGGKYEGIIALKTMQLCLGLKADIATTMADLKMIKRKQSEGMKEQLLNSQQVMNMLKIKRGTLQKYRDNKILRFVRLSGKICYKASDVESLLKSNYKKRPRKVKKHQGTYY